MPLPFLVAPILAFSVGVPVTDSNLRFCNNCNAKKSSPLIQEWRGPYARVQAGVKVGYFSLTLEHQSSLATSKDTGVNQLMLTIDAASMVQEYNKYESN